MTTEHPITPPPDLVMQWLEDGPEDGELGISNHIATQAARWGSDQELEACCEWASRWVPRWPDGTRIEDELRAFRREEPPSLKEQALEQLDSLHSDLKVHGLGTNTDTIRRALESLPD